MMKSPADWLRTAFLATVAILAIIYVVFLQYLRTGLPGLPRAADMALFPVGWPELVHRVERRKQALRQSGSDRVFIVGMDQDFMASEAAFYQTDRSRAVRETTGAHLFGGQSLMYAYWFPPRELDGATLLLVSFRRDELKTGLIRRRCGSLGPIEEQSVQVNGTPFRAYYTRVVRNYQSDGYHRPK